MLYNVPFDSEHPKQYRNANDQINNEVAVLEIGHNFVPNGMSRLRTRNVYIIHYVVAGKGVFLDSPFDSRCGYMVAPGELENITADLHDPFESYWIMLRGVRVPEFLEKCGLPTHNAVFSFSRTAECGSIIRRYLDAPRRKNETAEASLLQAAFYELMSVHLEESTAKVEVPKRVVQKVAEYLEQNSQRKLRISEVAERFFLSQNHMCIIFRQEYGVSPQEYLLALRIEKAKALLTRPDEKFSVKTIAASVGFENPLYFSRCFHRRVGCSPSEYRKRALSRQSK